MNIDEEFVNFHKKLSSLEEKSWESVPENVLLVKAMEDQTWKNHLISSLHIAWKEGLHTDLTIQTEDETFDVHKVLLSISSPYFKALLSSNFSESSTSVLNLDYIEGKIMKVILTYVYSGKADLTDVAAEVLVWADYFQIYELKRLCCTFITKHISFYPYLTIYEMALKHHCLDLASVAIKMAAKVCSQVFEDASFLNAQFSTVSALLRNVVINVYSEDELFIALRKWVNYKKEERESFYPYLLASINEAELSLELQAIYQEQLSSVIPSESFGEMNDILHTTSKIRFKKGEELLFVIGGESCGRILGNVECSSAENLNWRCSLPMSNEPKGLNYLEGQEVIRPMNNPRSLAAVARKNNVIYVLGGQTKQNNILSSCETYHIEENEWREFASLPMPVYGAQSVVLDDKLWVMGGASRLQKHKEGCLLVFDEKQKEWTTKAPMLKGRTHFGAAMAYGCIFVFGGVSVSKTDDGRILSSCEKYDIDGDRWIPIAPLGKGRAYYGVAVMNDLIYVMGGYSGSKWLDSVECYDPLADRWTTVSPMIGCRSSFGVAVWNKRIYCIGGFNGESTLSTVLKYNPRTDMWHGEHNMHFKRYGLMVSTITLPVDKVTS